MAHPADAYVREILRLEGVLKAYLHRFAPKPADLEDLLQETYSHLFAVPRAQRDGVRNVQAFALASARNVAVDWVRHRRVVAIDAVEDLDSLPLEQDGSTLDEIVNAHQQLLRVAEAVGTLPDRCREVFTLRRVYGWSQREIAQRLGITEQTVEQHLVKGMRRCAELMMDPSTPGQSSFKTRINWLGRWRNKRTRREQER